MIASWQFRVSAAILSALLCVFFASNLAVEFLRPPAAAIAFRTTTAVTSSTRVALAELATKLAPQRSDIRAEYALTVANQVLLKPSPSNAADSAEAQNVVRRALSLSPLNSSLWAALTALKARRNLSESAIQELLKLSYYTGPYQREIIPLRLDIATLGNALSDPDLRELAKGDVRAMIGPAMTGSRQDLANDYYRGSSIGKEFLTETVQMLDPSFTETLRRTGR